MKSIEECRAIEALFTQYYEKNIESLRSVNPQFAEMTNTALIHIQDDFLTAEVKKRNVNFSMEKLSAYQRAEYDKALVQQLFYVLVEGDFNAVSGYDQTTNTFAPASELRARALSPAARQTLTAAGLFYRALNGGVPDYRARRW